MSREERQYSDTPFGRMPIWHPRLDARAAAYGRPFEVVDQHQLAVIAAEHIKPVQGKVIEALDGDLMLVWPTYIELYVYEGTLTINGVECGPMERASWAPVVPVRVTERAVLGFAPAEDRSEE